MNVTGYPLEWNKEEGLMPIELQDVLISTEPDELRTLAEFLLVAAKELDLPNFRTHDIMLGNSNPLANTGISFFVMGRS